MTSISTTASSSMTFDEVYAQLKKFPAPLLAPAKVSDVTLTDKISSLFLHPALESLLHLLNHDLPSAHFLVRHMQTTPQFEGMYVHGILHRIEGDMNNVRAWYSDVSSRDCFTSFYGPGADESTSIEGLEVKEGRWHDCSTGAKVPPQTKARDFLDAVAAVQKDSKARTEGEMERLERISREEFDSLIAFCAKKFGTGKWEDVSSEWAQPEGEHKKMGQDMVSGGKGFRSF